MRIGLLTTGESRLWCDRLVRGLPQHEFEVYAMHHEPGPHPGAGAQDGGRAVAVHPAAPGATPEGGGRRLGRRARRAFAQDLGRLLTGVCAAGAANADAAALDVAAFDEGLHGLAGLARDHGGLASALRSEPALRVAEAACRAPGASPAAAAATVPDLLAFTEELERALRPLSFDWYEGLGRADVCHAAGGGVLALPGLVAKRFFGVPLLVTEYGVPLRAYYLRTAPAARPAVRALLAGFHRRLAAVLYREADLLTPGNAHVRRWQERCGAPRERQRTVYPGMEADRFAGVGEAPEAGDPDTLVWVGRAEPAKDLIGLLHAFAEIRRTAPQARLRLFVTAAARAYLADCRSLAAQLFPDEAADAVSAGESPVTFEELGGPETPTAAEAYGTGRVAVLSSVVEGFPVGLVEAMLSGRATVSTDVGAVREVVGGTGLLVPPRNPKALAEACLALLTDPERAHRLGAAARARADAPSRCARPGPAGRARQAPARASGVRRAARRP
ncbi:glycosyltransferase, partial [Streptomyces sp. WAC06614]|uniref:glycosyltransferase n=1 Tax=Streptomyces sp. WAC06614 TaxID=2487416 RepID=UPI000F789F08